MFKKLFFIVISIVISIVALEFVLQGPLASLEIPKSPWLYNYWVWDEEEFLSEACSELDSQLIYSLIPNGVAHSHCPGTTSLGFRKTPGLESGYQDDILFIGDSFTMSQGVESYEAFPFFVGTLLNDHGHSFNIHNAGVMGYSTDQSVVRLENLLSDGFDPEIVVLSIYENDYLADNNEACLFKVSGDTLTRVSAELNTMYLSGLLIKNVPPVVKNARLFWLALSAVPYRHTIGCTASQEEYDSFKAHKLKLLTRRVEKLSQEHDFELIVNYITGRDFFEYGTSDEYLEEIDYLVQLLQESTEHVVVLHRELIKPNTPYGAIDLPSYQGAKVLGISSETHKDKYVNGSMSADKIFLENDLHFNKNGNYLEAEIIAEKIKNIQIQKEK